MNNVSAINIKNTPVRGGVAVIEFISNNSQPEVYFYKNRVYVKKIKDKTWQAIVGLPLNIKTKKHSIKVVDRSTRNIEFVVKQVNYPEQRITLKGKKKKYIKPSNAHIKRIIAEKKLLQHTMKVWSNGGLSHQDFIMPAQGILTSKFGVQRFFNGVAKRPHSGIDIANKKGAEVKTAASGEVILVGDFYFNGKTIFVDHGQGLITVYIHLDKILVKNGEQISQGKVIGLMGQTGRTTGVNLHFGVYLNEVAVNPELFL